MLEIAVQRDGDTGSIALSGELDRSRIDVFEEQFRRLAQEQAVAHLILDMQALTSIDPAGLDAVRTIWASAQESGVELILVRASSEVRFALEESGLDRVIPVVYECPERRPV
jgi:anti-anti-sigma factor